MGQFILFLLGLFAIGCVLYGISAGVQIIQRGFAYLTKDTHDGTSNKRSLVTSLPTSKREAVDVTAAQSEAARPAAQAMSSPADTSPMQRNIDELREIFALYQQGALTQAEFEIIKQYLLTYIKTAAPQGH